MSAGAVLNAAEVIANSASIAVNPPWTVPAEVESHLLQGRTPSVLPSVRVSRAQAREVMERRARQLARDQRTKDLEAAAPLELLLGEHLALDLAAQGVVWAGCRAVPR